MTFEGFSEETFRFLGELMAHNEKPWFEANRRRYEAHYLKPALAFIDALGPRLETLPGDVHYESRVNGSLFRINRDVRFSKDKTPYKHHIDMWFWQGERKGWESPGYFIRLLPDEMVLGAGMHGFSKQGLAMFRQAVLDEQQGAALERLVADITTDGRYAVGGQTRKAVPRGFDAAHPRADFLRFEGLTATLESPIPAEAEGPEFVEYCFGHFLALSPVNQWLATVIGETE